MQLAKGVGEYHFGRWRCLVQFGVRVNTSVGVDTTPSSHCELGVVVTNLDGRRDTYAQHH